jgi:RimJ/RimL family protein N-acetyltransferase
LNIPTLVTPRLTLRPFTEADIESLCRLLNTGNVLRYFPNPAPPPRERVERMITHQLDHWAKRGLGWWALEPRTHPELIGWAGLEFLPETNETEVAYLLGEAWWGQGLAAEAARAALEFGFETHKLEAIIALVHPENQASLRVAEKLGMSWVDRKNYWGLEVCRYALRRSAFRPIPKA